MGKLTSVTIAAKDVALALSTTAGAAFLAAARGGEAGEGEDEEENV